MTGANERVYRGMQEDADGSPRVGQSARRLGARREIDIEVAPGERVEAGLGGMSVSPGSPMNLPRHRRPPEWGGTGLDPVWEISTDDLGPDLDYRADPMALETHGFIEPANGMTFADYQNTLAGTRSKWRRVSPTI